MYKPVKEPKPEDTSTSTSVRQQKSTAKKKTKVREITLNDEEKQNKLDNEALVRTVEGMCPSPSGEAVNSPVRQDLVLSSVDF